MRHDVFETVKRFEIDKCPFTNLPEKRTRRSAMDKEKMAKARWLRPKAVAEIAFNECDARSSPTPFGIQEVAGRHIRDGCCIIARMIMGF
jgi:hypothetical protein